MRLAFLAVLAVLSACPAAAAEPNANQSDIRCIVAYGSLAKIFDFKASASTGLFYFLGRVQLRDPAFDAASAIREELGRMKAGDMADELHRCDDELKANPNVKTFRDLFWPGRYR